MRQPGDARIVFKITGKDNVAFLQDLVTNDLEKRHKGLVYAALLTPQGKFLFDFFLYEVNEAIFLDCAENDAQSLLQRLTLYILRRDVQIVKTDILVSRGVGVAPKRAFSDPRHVDLGWRFYGSELIEDKTDWTDLRIDLGVPERANELTPDSYILEHGFERLNGVDFRKGCYVGQEITARMKHKTQLRKGLVRVHISADVALHTPIYANGKEIGYIGSQSKGKALAYLRYDQAKGEITAGDARITNLERL